MVIISYYLLHILRYLVYDLRIYSTLDINIITNNTNGFTIHRNIELCLFYFSGKNSTISTFISPYVSFIIHLYSVNTRSSKLSGILLANFQVKFEILHLLIKYLLLHKPRFKRILVLTCPSSSNVYTSMSISDPKLGFVIGTSGAYSNLALFNSTYFRDSKFYVDNMLSAYFSSFVSYTNSISYMNPSKVRILNYFKIKVGTMVRSNNSLSTLPYYLIPEAFYNKGPATHSAYIHFPHSIVSLGISSFSKGGSHSSLSYISIILSIYCSYIIELLRTCVYLFKHNENKDSRNVLLFCQNDNESYFEETFHYTYQVSDLDRLKLQEIITNLAPNINILFSFKSQNDMLQLVPIILPYSNHFKIKFFINWDNSFLDKVSGSFFILKLYEVLQLNFYEVKLSRLVKLTSYSLLIKLVLFRITKLALLFSNHYKFFFNTLFSIRIKLKDINIPIRYIRLIEDSYKDVSNPAISLGYDFNTNLGDLVVLPVIGNNIIRNNLTNNSIVSLSSTAHMQNELVTAKNNSPVNQQLKLFKCHSLSKPLHILNFYI